MNNEYELYHYGVKGMKWGIRKASISTNNRLGGIYTDKQKKRMSRVAIRVEKRAKDLNLTKAQIHDKASEHFKTKGDKVKYKHNKDLAKKFLEESKLNEKHIEDIKSGKIKASRDYVVNTEFSTMPLLDMLGVINVGIKSTTEFKKSK